MKLAKYIGLAPFILMGMMTLSACSSGQNAPIETSAAVIQETTQAQTIAAETEAETEEETAEVIDDEFPPEPGMVRSPITNEWIDPELAEQRPIAVMYPTDRKAQPQYGLDRVSVFYEIMEEGSISRQMGVIEDWSGLDRIGNIRSIRDYFIYEALEWDAIICHFGGPEVFVKDMLTRPDVDNINGVDGVMGSSYGAYYRIPKGSKSEHTAYTDSKHIDAAIEKAGFERTHRSQYYDKNRWKFANASDPVDLSKRKDAVSAKVLDMKGCYPITGTVMKYNQKDGKYYRNIYGAPQCDAVTKEQMAFSNVLIESADSGERGAGYLYFHVLDEGHEGYYATGGSMIHVRWGKTDDYQTTKFYNDDGEEIVLNTGKTMVFIARTGKDSFKADEVQFHF